MKLDESTTAACSDAGNEWTDEWIECMARHYTDPQNHQLGTSAISRVLDTQLRVFGVEGGLTVSSSTCTRALLKRK